MHYGCDPVQKKPLHNLGYVYDSLDKARDNMTLHIHPDRHKTLLIILAQDVRKDEQGVSSVLRAVLL